MTVQKLLNQLEELCPLHYALGFDKSGLQIGYNLEDELKGIYICLDVTLEEIRKAKEAGANLILSHHPLLFELPERIDSRHQMSQKIIACIEAKINVYAMHTNYDVIRMGELAADMIGMRNLSVLMPTCEDEGKGIGMVGELASPIALEEFIILLKLAFHLDSVCVYGPIEKSVFSVAISPGSGKNMKKYALREGVDVLITGDITHHDGLEGAEEGLTIIDAGHYGIEHIFVKDMARQLVKMGLEESMVVVSKQTSPFQVL